jgi:ribonuclease HI
MSRDHDVLLALAQSLDIDRTIEEHGLHEQDLKIILTRAAVALGPCEDEDAPDPGPYDISVDGASRGNPGPAGAGFVIRRDGRLVEGQAQYLGRTTNNQAEYNALVLSLRRAQELEVRKVVVRSDSELMVRQINGQYQVKNEGLKPLFAEARKLIRGFESFSISHVPREENAEADSLANRAIDEFQNDA